ncbi:MAG: DoxX family protein [Nevskia sp.]|nr:DoxX family protein [Nevskia sp.]
MDLTFLVLQVLLLAFFLPSALLKLAGHPHMRKEFARFQYPYAIARLAGVMELIACALLLAGFRREAVAGLGAAVLVPVMIGAAWTNFTKRPAAFGLGTMVILAVCAALAIYRLRGLA